MTPTSWIAASIPNYSIIIGLEEVKDKGRKLIRRKAKPDPASLLEQAIEQTDTYDKLDYVGKSGGSAAASYGDTRPERLFGLALELCITWVNRVLFMKLLEAQLQAYHRHAGDGQGRSFLHSGKVPSWDELNALFFQVLARKPTERSQRMQDSFGHVPYLNSSLFEPSALEHDVFMVSSLSDSGELPLHPKTVLRDHKGKPRSDTMPTLAYLLAFLDAYDFSSDTTGEEIQEQNKPLINASVLGLIFEKINGYKEGSFFTPGFITMYMCRETLRRAVCQRFSEHLGCKR